MAVYVFSKAFPVFIRTHCMKTSSIEYKAKWRPFDAACEDVAYQKGTFGIGFDAFSLAFSIAISEASIPTTWKFCWESHIALSPVPQPISIALQGFMGVVVTV